MKKGLFGRTFLEKLIKVKLVQENQKKWGKNKQYSLPPLLTLESIKQSNWPHTVPKY